MIEKDKVVLGGRTFIPTEEDDVVFEQYGYIQRAAADAGMGQEMMEVFLPLVEELEGGKELGEKQLMQISEKILMRAFEGRAYLKVLSGILVAEGEEWTRDSAEANCEYFAKLKGDDIPVLHQIIVMAIMGFFTSGLRSMVTSRKSSERRGAGLGVDVEGVTLRPKKDLSADGESASEISAMS